MTSRIFAILSGEALARSSSSEVLSIKLELALLLPKDEGSSFSFTSASVFSAGPLLILISVLDIQQLILLSKELRIKLVSTNPTRRKSKASST